MEESGATLMPVWRANLALLTREVGAVTRLARMMTFSESYIKLILAGRRDCSAEFVRGVEAVTGLPEGWMDLARAGNDVPAAARDAIDRQAPKARFRGTAHPVRIRPVLRGEVMLGQMSTGRRDDGVSGTASGTPVGSEWHRRMVAVRKFRDLAVQDIRKLERFLSVPPVEPNGLRGRIDDVIAAAEPDERVCADLVGRLEQIEKHRELLLRHVSKLQELLARLGDE